jgi:8-oxo-dGTP diphosphatase
MAKPLRPDDVTGGYRRRDLFAEGIWPLAPKPRFGGAVFDTGGRILLREPSNHYGGYHWTFPKGRPDNGEHPTQTALRETTEETGHRPRIVGHLPGAFSAGPHATANYFYVMEDHDGLVDPGAMERNGETSDLRWATLEEGEELIGATATAGGRRRDLEILHAAFRELGRSVGP